MSIQKLMLIPSMRFESVDGHTRTHTAAYPHHSCLSMITALRAILGTASMQSTINPASTGGSCSPMELAVAFVALNPSAAKTGIKLLGRSESMYCTMKSGKGKERPACTAQH